MLNCSKNSGKYVITGYGRSGTFYLSTLLNDITDFTVKHEPRGKKDLSKNKSYYQKIYKDINQEKYLEINSYLRFWINKIKKTHEIIILARCPLEIYLSVCNRKPAHTHIFFAKEISEFCESYYFSNFRIFKFDNINNMEYIKNLCQYMNLVITKYPTNEYPKNTNKSIIYKTINDLPSNSKKNICKLHQLSNKYKTIADWPK